MHKSPKQSMDALYFAGSTWRQIRGEHQSKVSVSRGQGAQGTQDREHSVCHEVYANPCGRGKQPISAKGPGRLLVLIRLVVLVSSVQYMGYMYRLVSPAGLHSCFCTEQNWRRLGARETDRQFRPRRPRYLFRFVPNLQALASLPSISSSTLLSLSSNTPYVHQKWPGLMICSLKYLATSPH